MNNLTPETEQREYLKKAKAQHLELLEEKERIYRPVRIPEYERGA